MAFGGPRSSCVRPGAHSARHQDSHNDLTPYRVVWPFVSAGAHALDSDETLGPMPTRGSSLSARRSPLVALRSLAFLCSSIDQPSMPSSCRQRWRRDRPSCPGSAAGWMTSCVRPSGVSSAKTTAATGCRVGPLQDPKRTVYVLLNRTVLFVANRYRDEADVPLKSVTAAAPGLPGCP